MRYFVFEIEVKKHVFKQSVNTSYTTTKNRQYRKQWRILLTYTENRCDELPTVKSQLSHIFFCTHISLSFCYQYNINFLHMHASTHLVSSCHWNRDAMLHIKYLKSHFTMTTQYWTAIIFACIQFSMCSSWQHWST